MELDHGFCRSIYTHDPNGILVEWCMDQRVLDETDAARAQELLWAERPEYELTVDFIVHPPTTPVPA